MKTFRVTNDWTAAIQQQVQELEDEAYASVRVAAQAGSQVLYDTVKKNVNSIGKKTGNLANSIYQAFAPELSMKRGERQGKEVYSTASYVVSWRTSEKKPDGSAGQGGLTRAPHGHLVEYGHIARYVQYIDKRGEWKTAVRPEMRGKKKPSARAPQSVRDAYYVLRKTPIIVKPQPFIRSAAFSFDKAQQAMETAFIDDLKAKGIVQ
jgi:hypothetical protein